MQARFDNTFTDNVVNVEQVLLLLLVGKANARGDRLRSERLRRHVVLAKRRDGDEFLFRVAERSQLASEDTAGINVDGAVQPFGFSYRSVSVYDHRFAAVIGGPVVSDGQAKF